MKSVVILGNSPFVNQIDVPALFLNHCVIGFNGMGQHYPLDTLVCFDRWYDPGRALRVFHPEHIHPPQPCDKAVAFTHKSSPKPFLSPVAQKGKPPLLAFKYFSPSLALNWALLEGFKQIYLVGIDHVETDTRFEHHDGATCQSELTPAAHKAFKGFVSECAKHAEIYQTNPAVKSSWDLPFQDIERLYGP